MSLPKVEFQINKGGLGLAVENADGVCGLLLQGVTATGLALLTPAQIFNLTDAEAFGIDAAYDTANGVNTYRQLKEFYQENNEGRELWIMLVSTAVSLTNMVDPTQLTYANALLLAAAGRIKMLGVVRSPAVGYTPVTTSGIDADCNTAITKAQLLVTAFEDKYMPVKIILPALYWQGDTSTLPDLKTLSAPGVEMVLADTASGNNACIGLVIGRYAKIPVQRNPGRVKNGPITSDTIFLGSTTLEASGSKNIAIHDKGYLTFRQYVGKAGYFISDDPTSVTDTNDFSSFARNRVIDKVRRLAYGVFVEQILDEILIDAAGRISINLAKYFEELVENSINTNMTSNAEISRVTTYVDPSQNVLSTGKVCIAISIIPVGYNKYISIKLGFENPAN